VPHRLSTRPSHRRARWTTQPVLAGAVIEGALQRGLPAPRIDLPAAVLGLAALHGQETVADIGRGNGAYLAELAHRGHTGPVLGVDLSAGMLAAVRQSRPGRGCDGRGPRQVRGPVHQGVPLRGGVGLRLGTCGWPIRHRYGSSRCVDEASRDKRVVMVDSYDFGTRVEAERARLRKAAEAQRQVEASKREQQNRLAMMRKQEEPTYSSRTKEREHRSGADKIDRRAGASPELVWGREVGKACRDFLKYMKARDFSGATQLRHTMRFFRGWDIRGYGVGCVIFPDKFEMLTPRAVKSEVVIDTKTTLAFNVFLCEDNLLRLYTDSSIEHLLRHDHSEYPCVISDLKGDPQIGKFGREAVTLRVSKTIYKQTSGNPWSGSGGSKAVQRGVDETAYKPCFVKCTIDEILLSHAVRATGGPR
jgi:SAM-dependent methyltransferase